MNTFTVLIATALLTLPGAAWAAQQSTAQNQQSSGTAAADKSQNQQNGQDAKKADADAQTASNTDTSQDSLAAAARRAREQKKVTAKPVKVFTNDDLPSSAPAAGEKASSSAAGADDAGKSAANDEKTWRAKFAALHHKLEQDQAALEVMQRELGGLNLQYYSDPVKAMQQQYTRSDINDKTAQIEAKKKEIDADQQAISDAEDDLRKAGGDPGWAR